MPSSEMTLEKGAQLLGNSKNEILVCVFALAGLIEKPYKEDGNLDS